MKYHLLAHLEDGKNRAEVLSDLYAQIQDAFNEYGAQIMSPHFESQPKKPVLVPKSAWYAPPVSSPGSGMTMEPLEVEAKGNRSERKCERSATGQAQFAASGSKKRT